ncbi:hypothetical protein [Janthinobacterium sp. SUN176]|nr:hypothetical protein [Janthinobacterium sp. SUN176]
MRIAVDPLVAWRGRRVGDGGDGRVEFLAFQVTAGQFGQQFR